MKANICKIVNSQETQVKRGEEREKKKAAHAGNNGRTHENLQLNHAQSQIVRPVNFFFSINNAPIDHNS